MVRLIIFDCYGLVLNEGFPNTSQVLAKRYGGKWQGYQKIMYGKYFNMAAERKISQKDAWIKTVKDCHLTMTWQELRDLHYSLMSINERVFRFNKELNKRGYQTLLLSKNTRSQFADVCKKFHLKKSFKNIINTWELGLPKASKTTLREIMRRFKVRASEIVYADDQKDNLVDAKALGIKTVFVKNFKQFKKELNKFLKL